MTERPDTHSGLSAESLGRAFRGLADEHVEKHSANNDDTFALIEQRRSPSLRVVDEAKSRRVRVLAGAAAMAAGVILTWSVWGQKAETEPTEVALSYSIGEDDAHPIHADGDVVFSEARPLVIRFSDETRMELAPHTTLRLHRAAVGPGRSHAEAERADQGVVLRLAQGEVDVSLAESKASAYSFEAGKYRLKGLGSAFLFAYVPQSESLEVRAKDGVVVVDDPRSGRHEVEPGHELHLPRGKVGVRDSAGEDARAAKNAVRDPGGEPSERSVAKAMERTSPSFGDLAKEGRFAEIVKAAEQRGIDDVLASASADDLQQLGQAARYVGNQTLAERTFAKMISRFSGSTSARNAQFFLGRLYEQQGRAGEALSSYNGYLSQAGAGAYTMDALGRKLLLVKQTQGAQSARPIAQDYLREYPRGPYAKAARELAGGE